MGSTTSFVGIFALGLLLGMAGVFLGLQSGEASTSQETLLLRETLTKCTSGFLHKRKDDTSAKQQLPDCKEGEALLRKPCLISVVTFNVMDGGGHRWPQISAFLNESKFDFVFLDECVGWNGAMLRDRAREFGHPYSHLGRADSGYHVAVSSRFPIELVEQVSRPRFHHVMLHVKFGNLTILGTHLNPNNPEARLSEAKQLVELAHNPLRRYLVVGDLNSLSPFDQRVYEKLHLKKVFSGNTRDDPRLRRKYFHNGALDFRIMGELYSRFSDLGHMSDTNFVTLGGVRHPFTPTVPTKLDADFMNAYKMRLDFILGSSGALDYMESCRVVNTNQTAYLSDHYPVVCKFRNHILSHYHLQE